LRLHEWNSAVTASAGICHRPKSVIHAGLLY
jgi:hypothetical protein